VRKAVDDLGSFLMSVWSKPQASIILRGLAMARDRQPVAAASQLQEKLCRRYNDLTDRPKVKQKT
jgi:hypothetical protein